MGAQIIVAKKTDSVNDCMKKMLARDIRHLPVIDDSTGEVNNSYLYNTYTTTNTTNAKHTLLHIVQFQSTR
jgi:CBS domain-containing protein